MCQDSGSVPFYDFVFSVISSVRFFTLTILAEPEFSLVFDTCGLGLVGTGV